MDNFSTRVCDSEPNVLPNEFRTYLSGTGASAPGAGGASPGRPPRAAASIRAIAGSIVVGLRGVQGKAECERRVRSLSLFGATRLDRHRHASSRGVRTRVRIKASPMPPITSRPKCDVIMLMFRFHGIQTADNWPNTSKLYCHDPII